MEKNRFQNRNQLLSEISNEFSDCSYDDVFLASLSPTDPVCSTIRTLARVFEG